jgi:hypothetical protein
MTNTRLIIFFGLFFRILYAARIGYLGGTEGLDRDSEVFYGQLIQIARSGIFEKFEIGPAIMLNTIGSVMSVFNESVFFVCVLSCLAWLAAGLLFVKCLDLTDSSSSSKAIITLLFAFWPTAIPYTSIPLREAYQLLFVNLALFAAMSLIRTRQLVYWPVLIFGLVGAGSLHGGLAAFSVFFFIITIIFYSIINNDSFPMGRFFGSVLISIVIGTYAFNQFSSISYNISNGLVDSVQTYQAAGTDIFGRSDYKKDIEFATGFSAYFSIVVGIFQYFFEPLPHKISAFVDIILFFENSVRFLVIIGALIELHKSENNSQRTFFVFLFTIYFLQEAIWSLGTSNWGTASRHHVPAMGLLLITGAQLLILRNFRLFNYNSKLWARINLKKHRINIHA